MENLFCDFAVAKMVDELGFKEKCLGSYLGFGNGEKREDNPKIYKTTEPELFISGQFPSSQDNEEELEMSAFGFCHAPTWQQVKQWLWEKHKIIFSHRIHANPHWHCFIAYRLENKPGIFYATIKTGQELPSPIDAEIDAIKEAVEHLYEEHHKTKVL